MEWVISSAFEGWVGVFPPTMLVKHLFTIAVVSFFTMLVGMLGLGWTALYILFCFR